MEKREQDLLEMIKEKTEDINVPESLQPEQIEKMLGNHPKKSKKKYWISGLVAASILLVCGVGLATSSRNGVDTVTTNSSDVAEEMDVANGLLAAADYEEIYEYVDAYWTEVEKQNKEIAVYDLAESGRAVEESAMESTTTAVDTSSSVSAYSGDYSETNVRQEGVDEADVVKTDGRYLYVLQDSGEAIAIVDTENEVMTAVGEITAEENMWIQEFYVTDQKLILVASKYAEDYDAIMPRSNVGFSTESILAVTYDISEVTEPKEVGRVSQSGTYAGSRMTGGYLYLFSESYMSGGGVVDTPETYIPLVNEKVMEADDIFLPVTKDAYIYEILASVSLDNPAEIYDSKAIFSKGGQVYVSNENIYWYETAWNDHTSTTIRKLSYQDGIIEAVAVNGVDGYINDSFSIDEYDGYLRIVTTEDDTNSVYVLNETLEIAGEIKDIVEDERVYSARFMGETGYFVTFRETDPLFTVDFSDPENPEIIGELKIPGFSEYLHLYEEGKLLGIGMDADEETGVTGGVKLTMFDISEPADVKEENTYIMENVYSTDVFYDYKAALIDVGKNIIGFSGYESGEENYYIFSYDKEAGFVKEMEEQVNGSSYQTTRGVYIDNILYVIKGNVIESYNMLGYEKIDDIII